MCYLIVKMDVSCYTKDVNLQPIVIGLSSLVIENHLELGQGGFFYAKLLANKKYVLSCNNRYNML